jgi:hypothetical protein
LGSIPNPGALFSAPKANQSEQKALMGELYWIVAPDTERGNDEAFSNPLECVFEGKGHIPFGQRVNRITIRNE